MRFSGGQHVQTRGMDYAKAKGKLDWSAGQAGQCGWSGASKGGLVVDEDKEVRGGLRHRQLWRPLKGLWGEGRRGCNNSVEKFQWLRAGQWLYRW